MKYSSADKAFVFNGTDDYIQGTLNLNGSELDGSYTLSAWVKRSSTTNNESFLFYIGEDGTGDSIGFYSDSVTSYKLFHYNATTAYATSQPSILNTYRHIVATYDGTYRRIYIDGVMIDVTNTDVSAPLGIPNNPIFSLGMRYTNLTDTNEYLHGYMSNPKIYSVALEPSEVKKLYRLGRTGRSMVISDTAVGIGKVPEAQLDVRGSGGFTGDLTVGGNMNNYQYWFRGERNSQSDVSSQSTILVQYSAQLGATELWTNNNKYTVPAKGVYMVMGSFMAYPYANISQYLWVEVRKFSSAGTQLDIGSPNDMHTPYRDGGYQSWQFKQSHICNPGDYLQVYYRAASTGAMNLHSSWGNITIYKIG